MNMMLNTKIITTPTKPSQKLTSVYYLIAIGYDPIAKTKSSEPNGLYPLDLVDVTLNLLINYFFKGGNMRKHQYGGLAPPALSLAVLVR